MKRYITILFLCVILIYQYLQTKELKEHKAETITVMSDTISYFLNKLNSQTASIKTLKVDKLQLENILLKKDKELAVLSSEFSQINHLVKYNSNTIIDTIKIYFKDTIPIIFNRNGRVSDNWYNFRYTSTQKGLQIDSLSLPTQTTVLTGIKRKWFLGSETLTTDITNSNPYINISEIKSAEITLTQPWYKKWYVWLSAGIVCGWLTGR